MSRIDKYPLSSFLTGCAVAFIVLYLMLHGIKDVAEENFSDTDKIEYEENTKQLKDSITIIKIKEDEELKVVRSASNDSVVIIFKQLVSE